MPAPGIGSTPPLVDLSVVVDQLHKTPGASDTAAVQQHLDTASSLITAACIPLQPATITEFVNGGTGTVMLSTYPVTSVVSVTSFDVNGSTAYLEAGGTGGLTDGWTLDYSSGKLSRVGYGCWPAGVTNLQIVYNVGPNTVPPEVIRAVVVFVEHLWEFRRMQGTPARPDLPSSDAMGFSPTYAIPNQVYELLRDWLKPPRVA